MDNDAVLHDRFLHMKFAAFTKDNYRTAEDAIAHLRAWIPNSGLTDDEWRRADEQLRSHVHSAYKDPKMWGLELGLHKDGNVEAYIRYKMDHVAMTLAAEEYVRMQQKDVIKNDGKG